MRKWTSAAFLCFLLPMCATAARVTFSEITFSGMPPLTNQYASYGLSFQNAYWAWEPRCAGGDPYCVAGSAYPLTVRFTPAVTRVAFDWTTMSGNITVRAYDASDNLLGTYTNPGGMNVTGTGTLTGSAIAYIAITGSDNPGQVAIGTLDFDPVVAPASVPTLSEWGLAMLALLLLLIATLKVRRQPLRA